MKTNEVEKLTGISKQTIMYYEKEGLIVPSRDENDYRKFSDEDIQVLQLIKLLRSMNISIDDIKLVITKQLPFQECLNIQSEFIENSAKELDETQKMIKKYKDKQLPIIPALSQIENITSSTNFRLGYYKTTNTITLGRVLTKKFLIRTLKLCFLGSLLFGSFGLLIFGSYGNGQFAIIGGSSVTLIMFVFQVFLLAKGWGNLGLAPKVSGTQAYQNNPIYFVEFIETGIRYYVKGSIIKQLKYFKAILSNQDALTYYAYEDIAKVIVTTKLRYTGASFIAIETGTYDFTFIFNDGVRYYLYNSITLDHDLEYLAHILKNKVTNIDDKYGSLDKIINNVK